MAKQLFILSTMTNDQEFRLYRKAAPGRAPVDDGAILVKGKAGLPNKHLWTPRGVATAVTDEQLSKLRDDKVFQRLEANGWFTVQNTDPRDADEIAKDQAEGDGAKQLTKAEIDKKAGAAKPKGNGA